MEPDLEMGAASIGHQPIFLKEFEMPTVAHNMETARALYQSSMAGALIEVNKRGQIQTASFGTRLRDAAIHLFLGESARMDFRAGKAQQVAAKFLTMTQANHRAQQGGAEPMNLRNATVGSNHPVYETISGHFARAATYERPVTAGDQAFGNATYESIDEASYEVPVSSRQAGFNNATYASIDEALYEVPVSARPAGLNNAMYASVEDPVYAEIPSAVADTIREYASSQDLHSEILAQARPMVAYKVGQHIVPVGVGPGIGSACSRMGNRIGPDARPGCDGVVRGGKNRSTGARNGDCLGRDCLGGVGAIFRGGTGERRGFFAADF